MPDPRQIAMQRFQQQQQLNALIAQQQQLASGQSTRFNQQINSNVYRSLQSVYGQHLDLERTLEYIYNMESTRKPTNNPTTSTNNIAQQSRANQQWNNTGYSF